MMTMIYIFGAIFFFVFLLMILIMMFYGIAKVFLKFIEQATEGRLKFFNRDYCEPIYSKWPRPVEFF